MRAALIFVTVVAALLLSLMAARGCSRDVSVVSAVTPLVVPDSLPPILDVTPDVVAVPVLPSRPGDAVTSRRVRLDQGERVAVAATVRPAGGEQTATIVVDEVRPRWLPEIGLVRRAPRVRAIGGAEIAIARDRMPLIELAPRLHLGAAIGPSGIDPAVGVTAVRVWILHVGAAAWVTAQTTPRVVPGPLVAVEVRDHLTLGVAAGMSRASLSAFEPSVIDWRVALAYRF